MAHRPARPAPGRERGARPVHLPARARDDLSAVEGRGGGPSPPGSRHRAAGQIAIRGAIAAAVFVAAFLERWWFSSAWHEAGSLTSAFYYGDASRLVDFAIAIGQGRPFDNGIPFHPPGWPAALAAFLKLFGVGAAGDFAVPVAAVKVLLATISAGTVTMAVLIAYEAAGTGAMLAVALLGPFHFGHIVEGTVADTEALYGLCASVAVFAALRAIAPRAHRSAVWAAVAGAAGGYATLVRAEFVACAVVIAGVLLAQRARSRALLFAATCVVVLVPTTVWHWRSLSAFNASHAGRVAGPLPTFAPVTSYGPFNFAMANHENSDGGPNRDHPLLERCNEETTGRLDVGQLDLACPAVLDLYTHGYRIGAGWILSHPGDAASLILHKLAVASGFLAHGYLIDDLGAGVSGTRRRVDLVDPDTRALLPVHLALVLGGIWLLHRRPAPLLIVVAPVIALVASTVLFYGYVRLGTSYLPIVWVLQGTALAAMAGARQLRARSHAWLGVLAVIAVLLLIDGLRLNAPRRLALDGPRTDDGVLVQDETLEVRRLKLED